MGSATLEKDSLKILMIEDCPADILFYSDLLKKSFNRRIVIDTAATLQAVNRMAEKKDYDLIIIDLNVFRNNGVRTVKIFRSIFGQKTPIIILTNQSDANARINALMSGADDYLVKGRDDKSLSTHIIHHTVERYELVRLGHDDKRFL
jgi:DNA-binding response OmpR family regulator